MREQDEPGGSTKEENQMLIDDLMTEGLKESSRTGAALFAVRAAGLEWAATAADGTMAMGETPDAATRALALVLVKQLAGGSQ